MSLRKVDTEKKMLTGAEIVKMTRDKFSKFNFTNGKRYVVGVVGNVLTIMDMAFGMIVLGSSTDLTEEFVVVKVG